MPDSCNAAINEGYKNHTVIKIKHKDTKREFHLKSSTKGRLQRKVSYKEPITKESFLQRADYKGKFPTKSRLQKKAFYKEPITKESFLQRADYKN
jgi:hypothetical protein